MSGFFLPGGMYLLLLTFPEMNVLVSHLSHKALDLALKLTEEYYQQQRWTFLFLFFCFCLKCARDSSKHPSWINLFSPTTIQWSRYFKIISIPQLRKWRLRAFKVAYLVRGVFPQLLGLNIFTPFPYTYPAWGSVTQTLPYPLLPLFLGHAWLTYSLQPSHP